MSLETCKSSDLLTADAAISARPCKIHGITLVQASAACSVVLYDNASAASGVVIAKILNAVNSTSVREMYTPCPIECLNGCYADVTGSGAGYIVHWSPL